jgi:hypothetical protein
MQRKVEGRLMNTGRKGRESEAKENDTAVVSWFDVVFQTCNLQLSIQRHTRNDEILVVKRHPSVPIVPRLAWKMKFRGIKGPFRHRFKAVYRCEPLNLCESM